MRSCPNTLARFDLCGQSNAHRVLTFFVLGRIGQMLDERWLDVVQRGHTNRVSLSEHGQEYRPAFDICNSLRGSLQSAVVVQSL
jgi:hypothetical protein